MHVVLGVVKTQEKILSIYFLKIFSSSLTLILFLLAESHFVLTWVYIDNMVFVIDDVSKSLSEINDPNKIFMF